MKRVVMIAVIMAVITSLFAFSVYAAPTMGASFTTSISSDDSNITAYAYAVYEEGVYQTSTGGSNLTLPSFLISIRVVNNTDKWVIKDTDQFKIRLNGNTAVGSPFECIDLNNCQITEIATSSGKVDFTIKGDNSFILAPNETYTLSFRFVNSAGFTTTPSLQFFNNQFLNSAYSVDELVSLPADQLAYLSLMNENLSTIIANMQYSGSNGISLPNTYSNTSYSSASSDDKVRVLLRRVISNPIVNSIDTYRDPNTDTIHYNVNYNIVVMYNMRVFNRQAYSVISHSRLADGAIYIPDNKTNITDVEVVSSLYRNDFILNDGSIGLYPQYLDNYLTVIPSGYNNTFVKITYTFNYSSDSPVTPTWGSLSSSSMYPVWGNYTFDQTDYEYDYEGNTLSKIFHKLSELYKSLAKPSSEDNTEEAQDMNDEIHEQEQVWYDNNSDALEEVGLSNYRFSQSQSSGITQAVTQFQAVWNALGQWTNVYIFILILSISTYIIRHEPTTRVKQYRSSVQAERAERISYYGKKNAESRAASSGSTFKAALRRRK